jgi:methyl-accepting chemotaxis protein
MAEAYNTHRVQIARAVKHASSTIRAEEASAAITAWRVKTLATSLVLLWLVGTAYGGRYLSRTISGSLSRLHQLFHAIAQRDLTRHRDFETTDEFGQMGREANNALDVRRTLLSAVATQADNLSMASEQLLDISATMNANAGETAAQAQVVNAASEQVSQTVRATVQSTDGLAASVREIAEASTQMSLASQRAVTLAESAKHAVTRLGESSSGIGQVVRVINTIADQTNC